MKKFSSPATSSSNYRSLSLPKGRSEVTESTQKCHPERSAKHVVEGSLVAVLIAILLTACGENTTTEKIVEVATGGTEIVSSVKDLPKCTKNNEGEQALVKGESSIRVCVDGKWFATKEASKDTVYVNDGDFSCTTKEFKDKSGLKIICNGDSIGVVLNGVNGKDGEKGNPGAAGKDGENGTDGKNGTNGTNGTNGKDGAGCTIVKQTDTSATIKCGDSTMTLNFRGGGASADTTSSDTLELDSEKVAISLDSLSGYSQKGPFLKGSTVYLYELSDGRTLKQTNGNFTSTINSNDGRYKFQSRDLVSQYALLVVDGKYRNEVTGRNTTTDIKLQAYTNMLMRKSANVNLLTHLEKDRVFYLVTKEKMTVRAAKKQAQAEILKAFHIDASQFKAESEDLDVFGKTDADAALLAISILLQRDSTETELSVLLTDMASDMEKDGEWNDSAKRAEIAEWAATMDSSVLTSASKLATFRYNVSKWGLNGGNVPNFEKFVRLFWSKELGLGVCGDKDNPVGTVKNVPNSKSTKYYTKNYNDITSVGEKIRFICEDAGLFRWRVATDIEKDSMGWGHKFNEGAVRNGRLNSNLTYVYENKNWRYGTNVDSLVGKGCVAWRKDTVALGSDKNWYKCVNQAWRIATDIEKDTATWGAGEFNGEVRKGQVNTTIYYIYEKGKMAWRNATTLEKDTYKKTCTEDGTLFSGNVTDTLYVCDADTFREAKTSEIEHNKGCTSYNKGSLAEKVAESEYGEYGYLCKEDGSIDPVVSIKRDDSKFGILNDERDGKSYYTIKIGNQVWMAENLNFDYKIDGVSFGNVCNHDGRILGSLQNSEDCSRYGRYYTWAAAVDSAAVFSMNAKDCGYGKTCTQTYPVRGVCPEGWHLPDSSEWRILYETMDSSANAMLMKGSQLAPQATDSYGFSAKIACWEENPNGQHYAIFWAASECKNGMCIEGEGADYWILTDGWAGLSPYFGGKGYEYSVRCVKDAP